MAFVHSTSNSESSIAEVDLNFLLVDLAKSLATWKKASCKVRYEKGKEQRSKRKPYPLSKTAVVLYERLIIPHKSHLHS